MHIDLYADVVCPWCYLGTVHLQQAMHQLDQSDITVRMRSFQLDPAAPTQPRPLGEVLGPRYGPDRVSEMVDIVADRGRAAGIEIALDPTESLSGNTMLAHRVLQAAWDAGVQDEVAMALYRAYFGQRGSVFDEGSLRACATAAGMPPAAVESAWTDPEYGARVVADIARARELGISGVPFFVIDNRYGVAGAQPPQVLADVLRQARDNL